MHDSIGTLASHFVHGSMDVISDNNSSDMLMKNVFASSEIVDLLKFCLYYLLLTDKNTFSQQQQFKFIPCDLICYQFLGSKLHIVILSASILGKHVFVKHCNPICISWMHGKHCDPTCISSWQACSAMKSGKKCE